MTSATGHLCTVSLLALALVPLSGQTPADPGVEEIYVVRSVREATGAATPYCDAGRTGVPGLTREERYAFRSTAVRGSDGRMTDADASAVGTLHSCSATSTTGDAVPFYGEGTIGRLTFKGRGECRTADADMPEPGMMASRCYLKLSDLPEGYVGGQLTTNSIRSKAPMGMASDPPGYTQSSIATVRVWKKRPAPGASR
jgi:hypothetical protein